MRYSIVPTVARLLTGFLLAAMLPGGTSARRTNTTSSSYAITDVTVINPRRSTVTPHRTVVISNGVIGAVQPVSVPLSRTLRQIDGRGRFLIPGIWDAHTHLSKTGRQSLALFVANGVTGVRDMGSNLAELSAWKRGIARNQLVGPTMMVSGPMIEARSNLLRMSRENGVEAFERQRVGVANAQEARAVVRQLARAGVDQIKMRTAPDLATFVAIARAAGAQRLPFAAHPFGRTEDMLGSGVDSIEHLLERMPAARSDEQRQTLFKRMAAERIYVSNTLVNIRGLLTAYDLGKAVLASPDHRADPNRRYLCGYLVRDWAEQVEENRDAPFRALLPQLAQYTRDLKALQRAGVPLLAGSDAGVMFTYPGFSMHDEMELMVRDAGLAPMDVLRIATDGVPAYFGRQNMFGAVEPGQAADLVLLDADPARDIRNTRRIRGVMAHGHWLDRAALDQLLAEVARDASGPCTGGSNAGRPVRPVRPVRP
jgi:imidazolonepropionase-like amidohydrolase